ncbi:MAG: Formamidopyrimidine-DNA glycosylase [Phycisphaerae bacterium]|nr:Formamidopyrimidine-DNA glycosylase [Phycisphaerae bacterium]
MPELPDILVYVNALRDRVVSQRLDRARVLSPFLLRTHDPPLECVEGRHVVEVGRIGKRITIGFDNDVFLVFHLMIAGRFRWSAPSARLPGKITLASLAFPAGTLVLTETAKQKRASLHVVAGRSRLAEFDSGGLDVLSADLPSFTAALRRENHTLKRALTDPRILDGIGQAYSDEILHAARLSPVVLTSRLTDAEAARLHLAAKETLARWTERLREQFAERFPGPGDITAFRADFAVHGRFGAPCPVCGTKVQRIRYAENETNYCPTCQTGGRLLADRSMSRLLGPDRPRTVDDLE